MIESIERNGTRVMIGINTGLERIVRRVLPFQWEAVGSEIYAELLKEQLLDQLQKFKVSIAMKPHFYLEPKEMSALKSMLKDWNGAKHGWK